MFQLIIKIIRKKNFAWVGNESRYLQGNYDSPVTRFSQEKFCKQVADSCKDIHMSEWGFYYRPEACDTQSCKVHLHIHGCTGSFENYRSSTNVGGGKIILCE